MPETRYFVELVLRKRPYLTVEMCLAVLANPLNSVHQTDGRICHWGSVNLPNDEKKRPPPARKCGIKVPSAFPGADRRGILP